MREGCGAGEGQLKGLFEEEAAEDHEVVPVAVLGLHYLGGVNACLIHECHVLGLSDGGVRVCR